MAKLRPTIWCAMGIVFPDAVPRRDRPRGPTMDLRPTAIVACLLCVTLQTAERAEMPSAVQRLPHPQTGLRSRGTEPAQ